MKAELAALAALPREDDRPPDRRTEAPEDGSRLCLACGICCQGALHREASIRKDEVEAVRSLGLPVIGAEDNPSFPLPCPLHQQNRCTVYADRPSPCRAYQCKLLKRYIEGSTPWEECIRYIDLLKELMVRVRRGIGMISAYQNVWQEVRSLEPSQLATLIEQREVLMDVVSFLTLCRSHFQNRATPSEVLGP